MSFPRNFVVQGGAIVERCVPPEEEVKMAEIFVGEFDCLDQHLQQGEPRPWTSISTLVTQGQLHESTMLAAAADGGAVERCGR